MKKKYWILLVLILAVLGGSGYMVFKQHTEKEKMIAIAHSDEAKKVYNNFFESLDSNALSKSGKIKTYEIEDKSLKYNPMGGLMVHLIINSDRNLNASFNLIDQGDGSYSSAYYLTSERLEELIGRTK
ncbi:DUF1310 family protein [Streptococcus iniae]|uniref:DUF1310 family protein n=1 Tax=Streptococcus iniae TaxID=1346 RepID=UPI0003687146|nr:DUF1310 family protein [Streptococcus iniae]ESR08757.1 hypothetical protein IUSA1_10705 [Streptococcus iniae IUSA1]OHX26289.1 hypothetical protein BKX95_11055 [Streptococcus iniae]RLV28529.1 DUF1310 family protein [Streptococcus iniae]